MTGLPKTELPKIGAPATRALASAGISTLEDLSQHTEAEILALHGMGPKALGILRGAMQERGLQFKEQRHE